MRINELLTSTGLAPFRDRPAGKLSGGMKQKLGLCCALIHDPELLILDEPTTGVDPLSRAQFWDLIDSIRQRQSNMSVLVATAYMEEAERFDWLVAMNAGEVLPPGSAEELRQQTQSATLEEAFINLLPQAQRQAHQAVVIPPYQPENAEIAIEARDLTMRFGSFVAVDHVNFRIPRGEIFGFLGSNGCGKSTMAKLFNGMLVPTSGTVTVDGIDTAVEETQLDVRRRVGLVQQNPDNQLVAGIVEEDVAFGPENLGIEPAEIRRRVDAALKAVNMYEYRDHAPHKLSGGQKQRVAIAGVIAMETMCIVLDEPTAMLDPRGRQEVMDTIRYLNREKGITVILITHYMDEAVQADRVVVMDGGNILTDGDPRTVFAQVELLKRHKLDVPQATELIYRLNAAGCSISGTPLDEDECVKAIAEYLKLG